jgi:acetaldehyde dehydrogenase/alcohol dehydrogenase
LRAIPFLLRGPDYDSRWATQKGADHIPHGLANALLICNVIRYNAVDNPTKQTAFSQYDRPHARGRYAEIADHLGLTEPGLRTRDKAVRLLAWLDELKAQLGIPASIQAAGVAEADFLAKVDRIAVDAFDDQCTGTNPRFPLISELRTLLLDSFYGRAFSEPIERIIAGAPETGADRDQAAREGAQAAE